MQYYTQRLHYLFQNYLSNSLSDAERMEFLNLIRNHSHEQEVSDFIIDEIRKYDAGVKLTENVLTPAKAKEIFGKILDRRQPPVVTLPAAKPFSRIWWKVAASAAILLVSAAGYRYFFTTKESPEMVTEATGNYQYDMAPGRNSAILTLSDGSRIGLDSALNGNLASEGATKIIKQDGHLMYKYAGGITAVHFNTISTARGNQYRVILPDGTKVWLNAESSITFPTVFNGHDRQVKMKGEAYFEVAKVKNQPFKVAFSNDGEISVLGTHFSICSYDDEPMIKTTLLEGSVRISIDGETNLLKPGEQARSKANTPMQIIQDADVEAAVAWKNGFFSFKDADIKTVMLQLARWYDLEISYEGAVGNQRFTGEIDRSLSLVSVLKILNKTKVYFKTESNKRLVILL